MAGKVLNSSIVLLVSLLQPDPRQSNLIWPTDKAAKVMVKAILKRKRNYVFTGHDKVFVWLQRWFPGLMRFIISKSPKPDS